MPMPKTLFKSIRSLHYLLLLLGAAGCCNMLWFKRMLKGVYQLFTWNLAVPRMNESLGLVDVSCSFERSFKVADVPLNAADFDVIT